MSNELAKRVTSLEEDSEEDLMDSIIIPAMMMVMIMLIMPMITQQILATYSRVQTLAMPPETTAQNVGTMWYEVTPLGQPNRLQMIGENSTGAFETILISLST